MLPDFLWEEVDFAVSRTREPSARLASEPEPRDSTDTVSTKQERGTKCTSLVLVELRGVEPLTF